MPAIDGAIEHITEIVQDARARKSRLGYFACLYFHVTRRIRAGMESGRFEHPDLMDKVAVTFAGRYFTAVEQWQAGERPTEAWAVSFETNQSRFVTVSQHMLSAVNAHVNLDLGAAVATALPADVLPSFRNDFVTVNRILGGTLTIVQEEYSRIWKPFGPINALVEPIENKVFDMAMAWERDQAWDFATELAAMDEAEWPAAIARQDAKVATYGRLVARPPLLVLRLMLLFVVATEMRGIDRIIDVLYESDPTHGQL